MEKDDSAMPMFKDSCWPLKMIWERLIHAYTSDTPPKEWGLQKDDCGFQNWTFNSHNEKYTVLWDNDRSYWKVNTPFGPCLFFIGPLFIDKTRKGLKVPPLFTVIDSENDFLIPAHPLKVKERMSQITHFVVKPYFLNKPE
ncbi:hypothetical protein GDO78_016884 [Eleutherodactylus coqui]|uniref:Uncharacterized protein n=1 Tax=Eleutherodactylus coqui TaxID=57060 RepID=A0A8J6BFI4_ELECQ|nr:hypothetical protein GDO78_016884 [Eleutherodactylus coqui]